MSEEKIRIVRAPHGKENPYFLMLRVTAQNAALTYEARGVLAYLLSKPGDWVLRPSDLECDGCQRQRVYRILKELREQGYITRKRRHGEGGKFVGIDYLVYENAADNPEPEPYAEKPHMVKPQVDKPFVVNQPLQNTEDTEDKKEEKESSSSTASNDDYVEEKRPTIYQLWESNMGLLTGGMLVENLKDAEKTYPYEWIEAAIREAVESNARTWKFVSAVLKSWEVNGFKVRPEKQGGKKTAKTEGKRPTEPVTPVPTNDKGERPRNALEAQENTLDDEQRRRLERFLETGKFED